MMKVVGTTGGKSLLLRKELLTFLPALGLAGIWYGWQGIVLILASAIAVAWMARGDLMPAAPAIEEEPLDALTGLQLRAQAVARLDTMLDRAAETKRSLACIVVGIEDADRIAQQEGDTALNKILQITSERLASALRDVDRVIRLEGARFGLLLQPTPRTDLESLIQLSARVQKAVEQPIALQQRTIYISAHIGFCLSTRAPERGGEALLAAAEIAATEAAQNGPSAIRAFSTELQTAEHTRSQLSREIATALEDGKIVAYFQPQLCSDTGDVAGFQAMPRWMHPERGVLSESEILPAVEAAGLRDRMDQILLYNALSALRGWDRAHSRIASVSLPMSAAQLADPRLPERLHWEMDRFDLAPQRVRLILSQEVVPQLDHDVISHNLITLAGMGFAIELSGFGTGSASVSTIRRSCADRIRLHRSFTSHIDTDPEQQRLVGALVTLAEGLDVQTLAEAAQTIGEHAMLAQLGCRFVQGAAIARPMGYEDTLEWIARHRAKLKATPSIRQRKL